MSMERNASGGEPTSREVLEALPGLAWAARADGAIVYASPQWLAYTGLPPEDALGEGWQRVVHPDDLARTTAARDATTSTGRPYDAELRLHRHDGTYRWFRNRATPVRDDAGEVIRWVGLCIDVEDEGRDERAGRYTWSVASGGSEATPYRLDAVDLEAALGSLDEAVVILDVDGRVVAMNATALRGRRCRERGRMARAKRGATAVGASSVSANRMTADPSTRRPWSFGRPTRLRLPSRRLRIVSFHSRISPT